MGRKKKEFVVKPSLLVKPKPEPTTDVQVRDFLAENLERSFFFFMDFPTTPSIKEVCEGKCTVAGLISTVKTISRTHSANPFQEYSNVTTESVSQLIIVNYIDPSLIWNEETGMIDVDKFLNHTEACTAASKFWRSFGAIYVIHHDLDMLLHNIKKELAA